MIDDAWAGHAGELSFQIAQSHEMVLMLGAGVALCLLVLIVVVYVMLLRRVRKIARRVQHIELHLGMGPR